MRPRFETLYALIGDDAKVFADIGYDLGALMVAFLKRRPHGQAVGVEIQPQAAARFRSTHAATLGRAGLDRVTLLTGSGLAPLTDRAAEAAPIDCAVIAGIGEDTTLSLCRASAELVAALPRLVICIPTFHATIRPGLAELGLYAADERLVVDRGRTYEVIAFEPGVEPSDDAVATLFGPRLFERRDPGVVGWLEDVRDRYQKAYAHGLRNYLNGPRRALGEKLARLDEALERARQWDDATRTSG